MQERVVLVLCTAGYSEAIKLAEGTDGHKGAVFESRLLLQRVYEGRGRNEGVVPILFDTADAQHISPFLRDVTYYDVSTEAGYEALYRRLTDQPAHPKPQLGSVRTLAGESIEPPAAAEAVTRAAHFAMPRLSYGRLANALTFSHLGASACPRYDTSRIEYFEPDDELRIAQFVRGLPGWYVLGQHCQVNEGIIISDQPERGVREFGGSTNGVHIRFDGSISLRATVIGAHFLYDVERILASTYAISCFMHRKFKAYPIYQAAFGYVLFEEPYPRQIGHDPYDGTYTMDVRRPFAEAATSAVMVWSRTAWPIGLTSAEVHDELARIWKSDFRPAAEALGDDSTTS